MSSAPETIVLDGIWAPEFRMRPFLHRLRERLGTVHHFVYENSGRTPLDVLGGRFAEFLSDIPRPVNVIAFSMGGLVARAAALQLPANPYHRAAFLNTPHQGSLLAWTLPLPALAQMRPGSAFLQSLDAHPWTVPTYCVWCPGDLMVVPGHRAKWPCAEWTDRCDVPAHMWPLYSKRFMERTADFLRTGTLPGGEPAAKTSAPSAAEVR
jgi:triacylglycerol lipase